MVKLNAVVRNTSQTHEGGAASPANALQQLRRAVLTCLLWEPTFYEAGDQIAERIKELVTQVPATQACDLAIDARNKYYLRHVPLFLIRELARKPANNALVRDALPRTIGRVDEMGEFLAMYSLGGRQPLSRAVKTGLADCFHKFEEYHFGKYKGEGNKFSLRDVMFLTHPKPRTAEEAELFKRIAFDTLAVPDTWEAALASGADKRETFERLLREGKLGGLAALRNLRGMLEAGVDEGLIRSRLAQGISKALPFRFVTAARVVPRLEDAIEVAMLKAIEGFERLPGHTVLLVDVSGSMFAPLSQPRWKGGKRSAVETQRVDAACGLAIYLRELADRVSIYTFSESLAEVAPRRGFALRDAIVGSQRNAGTYLAAAQGLLAAIPQAAQADRVIVITDEQSHDGCMVAWVRKHSYIINVAPYAHGVGSDKGWVKIDGWSERVVDYIQTVEAEGEEVIDISPAK